MVAMLGQVNEHAYQIYFIRGITTRRIKIGISKSPLKRLKALQTGSPEPLEMLFFIKGSREMEKELHKQFAALRQGGEWFDSSPDLLNYMIDLWRQRQAHKAQFMDYNKTEFYKLLVKGGYTW